LPSPECWVTISPGTASSSSPTREAGRAFSSSPLMIFSLAAAGWRLPGPDVAALDVTPLADDAAGRIGWTARALGALRAGRCAGLICFGCGLFGDVTVTGGSWPDVTTATV
jgi:hypothetical protein